MLLTMTLVWKEDALGDPEATDLPVPFMGRR